MAGSLLGDCLGNISWNIIVHSTHFNHSITENENVEYFNVTRRSFRRGAIC